MNEGRPLTGDDIHALLREVADALPDDGTQHIVVMAGGSRLAWAYLRDSTEDVDSVTRLDDALRVAARAVARRHGLADDWLNDRATPWWPQGLSLADCEVLFEHPRLRLLGVPLRELFLMKLDRAQPQDHADLVVLWPKVADAFETATAVVAAYRASFHYAPEDEFLADYVTEIAAAAGFTLPKE